MPIHPTAVVDKRAEIDPSAEIGPYAIVEAGVQVGPRCKIWPHAYISQGTTLAANVRVHPFAVVGHHPQDIAWKETPSYTTIGEGTIIREHATIHRGTPPETTTVIGKNCFIMSTGHVGHNCVLGDEVKVVNGVTLSGWCQVGDKTFLSGNMGAHQFTRIGELCMVSGLTRVPNDIIPFAMVTNDGVIGLNVVGLRRSGVSAEDRAALRVAYKTLFRSGLPLPKAIAAVEAGACCAPVLRVIEFLKSPTKRGFMRYHGHGMRLADDVM
ncbi:MAG: acyl-ACP--UDP-N-acetylglucosamine O-acyltransferase [Planctomycetes bacterium]|nr:acyl-ACP--UDP-N-acetylglucosamine O-acyltransferase [Planctomycetota bacterium]